jgi:hypothetical protein
MPSKRGLAVEKIIGLIGGISWEATVPYYCQINQSLDFVCGMLSRIAMEKSEHENRTSASDCFDAFVTSSIPWLSFA